MIRIPWYNYSSYDLKTNVYHTHMRTMVPANICPQNWVGQYSIHGAYYHKKYHKTLVIDLDFVEQK